MRKLIMSNQLELFPNMMWETYEYKGKKYKRYCGKVSYRKRMELKTNVERFIDEYNKETI
jgi:hypothetical protein|tara:strand:- start:140 stop:319 length:180 start_codon:yes stop_codon:yes gene_type:complete